MFIEKCWCLKILISEKLTKGKNLEKKILNLFVDLLIDIE